MLLCATIDKKNYWTKTYIAIAQLFLSLSFRLSKGTDVKILIPRGLARHRANTNHFTFIFSAVHPEPLNNGRR